MINWFTVKNGDIYMDIYDGTCQYCGAYIDHTVPHERVDNDLICADCCFIKGRWNEQEYIKYACYWNCFIKRAAVKDGKVYITDKLFPWEKTSRQNRNSPQCKLWRESVYKRDNYTCRCCGKRGGELNAHHIKQFKDFPDLRFDVDNGVTLCKPCHKRVHKEKDSEWLYLDK